MSTAPTTALATKPRLKKKFRLVPMTQEEAMQSVLARLDAYTVKGATEDDCWDWIGTKQPRGYGIIRIRSLDGIAKRDVLVHRLTWELEKGPIPDGMVVCHKCDNPPCRNMNHLFLGTQKDNLHDAIDKGRFKFPVAVKGLSGFIGSKMKQARHALGLDQQQLAEMVKTSKQCISKWERGTRFPSEYSVGRISTALKQSREYFFGKEIKNV